MNNATDYALLPTISQPGPSFRPSLAALKRHSTTPLLRALFLLLAILFFLTLHLLSTPSPPPTYLRPPPTCEHVPPSVRIDALGRRWEAPSVALPLEATLETRMMAWRESPIANGSDWRVFNDEACGNESAYRNENVVLKEKAEEVWTFLDSKDRVQEVREELIGVLEKAEREGRLEVREEEKGRRGIVLTAGNADTFERAVVSLRLLRSFGTELPAEVFHFPSEQPTSAQVFEYTKLNAVAREVQGLDKKADEDRAKSFHIKGAALLQSSFEELLYLDSDSLPAKDVTLLFAAPAYVELGVMLWPDYWKDSSENAIWSILGVQCRDEWTTEAGQLLVSKRRHLDMLVLVAHMLSRWEFFFTLSDGDKDLFRYALLALRKRWAVPGRHLGAASWRHDGDLTSKRWCGHTMMQYDHNGVVAFVHANLIKHIAGDFRSGNTWGRTKSLLLPNLNTSNPFPLASDHLVNANSNGFSLLPAPPFIRHRARLERGLRTSFHSSHRGSDYVLCVETRWEGLGEGSWDCPVAEPEEGEMRTERWEEDPVLSGWEERFYEARGRANGIGF